MKKLKDNYRLVGLGPCMNEARITVVFLPGKSKQRSSSSSRQGLKSPQLVEVAGGDSLKEKMSKTSKGR